MDDPDFELVKTAEQSDAAGYRHLRFSQSYKGLRVWPAELTAHVAGDGEMELIESTAIPTPRNLSRTPRFAADQALAEARSRLFKDRPATGTKPELIIYGPLGQSPRLAWLLELSSTLTDARRVVIDAQSGQVLYSVSMVHDGAVVGSGMDAQNITRTLNLWQNGATYYMSDTSKPMYNPASTPPDPDTTAGQILILDSRNTPPTSDPQTLGNPDYSTSSSPTSGWIPDAVSAAYGLSQVYDYYNLKHGRNSFDGNGSALVAIVRVGISYPNASWLNQLRLMRFGDGYSRSLDVCGHEVTHGVIGSIGDSGVLDYENQSGALNESFSDIFGEMVEARTQGTNDWLMGSNLSIGAIRNMANPNAFGQPGHMNQYVVTSSDGGGVHKNSGIINRAYFLLSAGLEGAIGNSDAERIFYRALTLHLQKQSQFIDARHACVASAEALFGVGSVQVTKTAAAFDAVGIIDAPSTAPPGTIPPVAAADSTMCLRFDPVAQRYYTVRRESALGDAASGFALYYCAPRRVSISGDGSLALFVTEDHDLAILATDDSSVEAAGIPETVHSVALSPDGRYAAIVVLDALGNPTDQIHRIDIASGSAQTYNLYALTSEGDELALVNYADVLDFTADGHYLIHDALCTAITAQGDIFDGWAIFSLDTSTGNIQTLTDPNTDFNVGNPALGNTKNHLLTFDVFDNTTGNSTVYAGNLFSGQIGAVGTVAGLGVPGYTGDDAAIVYSVYDGAVNTDFSLVRQAMSSDGITKVGSPTSWIANADYGVVYRRGTFISSNSLPSVSLTNPIAGQNYTNPASITFQATASDPGGSVTRVEFYRGSVLLGQDTTSPYSLSWPSPPIGSHMLLARAVDNLGGTKDSAVVQIAVYPPPDTTKPTVSIANPPSSRTYTNAQTVVISASASDNVGVARVEFFDSGVLRGTDANSPYTFDWSFMPVDNGVHSWTARAYDAAGNVGTSSVVTLTVSIDVTPPLAVITNPTNGQVVTTTPLTVTGIASDAGSPTTGINLVQVRVNGGSWSNATGTTSWNRSVALSPCPNTIEVRSRDGAGNYSLIASNFVTYVPPNTVPNRPTNLEPANLAANLAITPTLLAGAFTDADCLGDTHAASQWQVLNSAGSIVIADSGTDTVNKVSWTVPANRLYYGSNYQWRVRFRDSRNAWSSNSVPTTFSTVMPSLTGLKQGTNYVLRWPTNVAGFSLQWSPNLGAQNWSNGTPPGPYIFNGYYTVTNGLTNQFRFYRLKR